MFFILMMPRKYFPLLVTCFVTAFVSASCFTVVVPSSTWPQVDPYSATFNFALGWLVGAVVFLVYSKRSVTVQEELNGRTAEEKTDK